MELNERDLAWIVIIFLLFYTIGAPLAIQMALIDEKIPSYALRLEKAFKRFIITFGGLILILLLLSLLNEFTSFKVLSEIPKVWNEFEQSL